jgi:hypothetical protein
VAAIVVVLVVAAVAGPVLGAVAAAVGELVRVLLIATAVIGGLAGVGLAAVIAFRVYRWRAGGPARVSLPAPTAAQAVQAPTGPRPAIERPHEVHLHLHGVTAEEIAAILRRQNQQ